VEAIKDALKYFEVIPSILLKIAKWW